MIKSWFIILILLVFGPSGNTQEVSANIGLDTTGADRREVMVLWKNYLKSDPQTISDNPNWCAADKARYQSFDLLRSEGFLNPSIYAFGLKNNVLSLAKSGDDYIIRSAFINPENLDVYAITNVLAKKENGSYRLTNYQPKVTSAWKSSTIRNITYQYFPEYQFDQDKAQKANDFLERICRILGVKPPKLTYFICRDCDDIYRVKGFDFVLSMGNGTECGFFDSHNNIIYATALAGEAHQHEIVHVINTYFPNANELLLTGLSAYWGGDHAHKGKDLLFHIKRVDVYLKTHAEIDLNNPGEFWKLDQETNPQYVTGALLCDLAMEKGGIDLLKKFLDNSKSDEEMLAFTSQNLGIRKGRLNEYLHKKISGIAKANSFTARTN